VTLSRPPQKISPFREGDVQRGITWEVLRGSDGKRLWALGATVYQNPTVWDVVLLENLDPYPASYTIGSTTLKSAGGILVTQPQVLTFTGCEAVHPPISPTKPGTGVLDLENTTLLGNGRGITTGTGATYTTHDGIASLQKRVLRRLTTRPGEFKHLGLGYGVGLREKEPVPIRDLNELTRAIRDQVTQEPDVRDASVKLELSADNVLAIVITVYGAFGAAELPYRFQGIQF
jgi:hypothetical protein